MLRAFWILVLSAKIQSRAKEVEALKEQLKTAQEQGARTGGPNYSAATCRACHAWSVLSSELNEKSEESSCWRVPSASLKACRRIFQNASFK